ncbi:hypothetical protein CPAR01_14171 [Colletotrichum paranaense]|uniref:Uncharacterized protein n=2 Tax=Colletotrichum acutatum species complex TaxID=2707335 RepID=A0AAI9UQ98_9PEZI|nr:uncharacterized protein CPAR01_14171 [Colletotrichum paranaense]KAK1462700.1 hypothetical protein CMEL01_13811 [Colletotrichum melonis]KAK1523318.1 hypothetical protein CPAR01_14171 [Colletotrichum paranaense]
MLVGWMDERVNGTICRSNGEGNPTRKRGNRKDNSGLVLVLVDGLLQKASHPMLRFPSSAPTTMQFAGQVAWMLRQLSQTPLLTLAGEGRGTWKVRGVVKVGVRLFPLGSGSGRDDGLLRDVAVALSRPPVVRLVVVWLTARTDFNGVSMCPASLFWVLADQASYIQGPKVKFNDV